MILFMTTSCCLLQDVTHQVQIVMHTTKYWLLFVVVLHIYCSVVAVWHFFFFHYVLLTMRSFTSWATQPPSICRSPWHLSTSSDQVGLLTNLGSSSCPEPYMLYCPLASSPSFSCLCRRRFLRTMTAPEMAKLYLLIQVHKYGYPGRPFVSQIDNPTHNIYIYM